MGRDRTEDTTVQLYSGMIWKRGDQDVHAITSASRAQAPCSPFRRRQSVQNKNKRWKLIGQLFLLQRKSERFTCLQPQNTLFPALAQNSRTRPYTRTHTGTHSSGSQFTQPVGSLLDGWHLHSGGGGTQIGFGVEAGECVRWRWVSP